MSLRPHIFVSLRSVPAFVLALLALPVTGLAQSPIRDTPFFQEYHEAFPLGSAAENDVRAIALDRQQRVWIATAAGVRYLEGKTWRTPSGSDATGPANALRLDRGGRLYVGAANGLFRATPDGITPTDLDLRPVGAISIRETPEGETVVAAGPDGIRLRRGSNGWRPVSGAWHRAIRAVALTADNALGIGSASGLYRQSLAPGAPPARRFGRPDVLLSSNIHDLEEMPDGTLCIASTGGLDFYRGEKRVRSLSQAQGMPFRTARSVTVDADGRYWIATPNGVVRREAHAWTLRHSRRWLLDDDVRDVAVGPDGTAWVATAGGVDAIRRRKMTLADKADELLKDLRARHLRPPGLVGPAVLVKPGDLSESFIEDDDNDGEHTGMYLAMESMRYAVTKDPQARENAKAAFHALEVLQQVTGTRHFIARSVLPIGTPPRHEVDRTFTPLEIAESRRQDPREKIIEKRWVPSADGKWLWKRDASSDEVDGHMFGYSHYFDLAADDEEKKRVAAQVDRIIGGIVDHGFVLRDIDGVATRWGHWNPESLVDDPTWNEESGGNAIEILAFLGVAYHMTKNPRYIEATKLLTGKYGYDKRAANVHFGTPSEHTHIEDELLSMVYPYAVTHAVSPELRQVMRTSMRNWHRFIRHDRIPFYDFVYNRYSGDRVPLDAAVEQLRDWPLDHIEWTVDNRLREDIERDLTPGIDEFRLKRLPPRSEMGLCMFDQEPYKAVIGRNGEREDRQNDWLMAYWMGRYYGLIGPPER
ncbi:MAG: hypothetical protein SFU56_17220 [Capsulimonadales bacterium]|nr:hypothetical protein [Capsulimonadales bacterium]